MFTVKNIPKSVFSIDNEDAKNEEVRMLDGNMARVCLSKNPQEITEQAVWAKRRLDRIVEYVLKKAQKGEKKNV